MVRLSVPAVVALALSSVGTTPIRAAPLDPDLPSPAVDDTASVGSPFARDFGVSAYYSGWGGGYDASGVGFRLRWEPLSHFGLEVYTELLSVAVPVGSRVQLPSGFNLYVPFEPLSGFRVRGLAGLCTMFVFSASGASGGPSSEDVQFGVHVGAGAELELHDHLSVFLDVTYQGYWGHGHESGTWTSGLDEDLRRHDSAQLGLGLQLHL